MSASSPGNGQYGGVLAGVKAKPSMWPTASLDTGCGHHPPAAARGSSKQLHHKIPTTEVPTESGEARSRGPFLVTMTGRWSRWSGIWRI